MQQAVAAAFSGRKTALEIMPLGWHLLILVMMSQTHCDLM